MVDTCSTDMFCFPSLGVCVRPFWKYVADQIKGGHSFRSMRERITAYIPIRFMRGEGEKIGDIHRRMKRQYRDICVSLHGTGSLKVGCRIRRMQLAPAGLTLRTGLTLMLKWN